MAFWIEIDCPACRRRLRLPAPERPAGTGAEKPRMRLRVRCAACAATFTIRRPRPWEKQPAAPPAVVAESPQPSRPLPRPLPSPERVPRSTLAVPPAPEPPAPADTPVPVEPPVDRRASSVIGEAAPGGSEADEEAHEEADEETDEETEEAQGDETPAGPRVPAYVRRRPYRSLDPEVQARSRRRRRVLVWVVALVAVVVAAAVWWTRPLPAPVAPVPSAEDTSAVAVLGWQPAEGGLPSPWLGAALSRMLAVGLENAGVPRVVAGSEVARVARESGQESWGVGDPLGPVARNLGVGRLLLGSYREIGSGPERVALELRLMDADGETLASVREEAAVASLGPVLGRMAMAVVQESGTDTTARAPGDLVFADYFPTAPLALEPYARGSQELDRSLPASARAYLRLAALAAPGSAEVQRALAEAWGTMGHRGEAEKIGRRALELGADLPERWRLRAEAELDRWRGDPASAARLYGRLREGRPQALEPALDELRAWLEAGRADQAGVVGDALAALPPPAGEDPRVALARAAVAELRRQPEAQLAVAERALEQARIRGAVTWEAAADRAAAAAETQLGHPEAADALLRQARRLYRDADDPTGVGRVELQAAILAAGRRDAAGAEEAYDAAEATFRRAGDLGTVAAVLLHRGRALATLGQQERGLESFRGALDLYGDLGDLAGEVSALRARSELYRASDDPRAAEGELRQAMSLLERAGETIGESGREQAARVQLELGEVLAARERFGPAAAAYRRSLELAETIAGDLRPLVAGAHAGLADLSLQQGDLAAAREHQEAALGLRRELGDSLEVARVELALASLDLAEGEARSCEEATARLVDVFLDAADSSGLLAARVLRARALTALGETLAARRELSAASAMLGPGISTELGLAVSLADARLVAVEGDPRRAVRILQQQLAGSVTAERMGPSLELRLALGELELAGDLEAAGRSRLRSVREDAAASGYVWIAKRAEAALR